VIEVRGRESGHVKVIAGNCGRGPSMTARRRRHPGSKKLVALTRGGRRRSSAGEAPKGAAHATRVSEEVVRDRSGEAEEAPRRVRTGEGRKTSKDERELADRPTTGRERRQAIAVTGPLDPRSASRRGIARTAAEALGASSNAPWHEGSSTGFGPPESSRSGETSGAERHARLVTNRSRGARQRRARAGRRSDWVLVRGGRSVEVGETCLSCRSGARARASSGRTIAGMSGFPIPAGSAQAGPKDQLLEPRAPRVRASAPWNRAPLECARDGQGQAHSRDKGAMQTRANDKSGNARMLPR